MEIFISYSREDEIYAKRIYDSLLAKGCSPWLDKVSLLPGQKWEIEIEKAIRRSNFVILLLSNNSVDRRGYFQREVQLALDVLETIPSGHIFLIPARLTECDVPETLKALQWVDMFPDWDKGLDLIRKGIYYQRTRDILTRSIEEQAPAPNDVNIIQPDPQLDPLLRAFSGHWIGRWGRVLPSQLIVERIEPNSATIVYTWGEHPSGAFKRGWHRYKAQVVSTGELRISDKTVTFTFKYNEHKDVIHGVREAPQSISRITTIRKTSDLE